MSEKVLRLNGQLGMKEHGWHYYIDSEGDISREIKAKPWSKKHAQIAQAAQQTPAPQQIVAESGIGETNEQFKL